VVNILVHYALVFFQREEKIEMKLKEEMDSREKKRSEKTKREEEERIERKKVPFNIIAVCCNF